MVPKAFEAGYANTVGFRKVVKATILIRKKEGMSDEDFIEHYNNVHAQRAVPILQRHGIISYSLVMQPISSALQSLIDLSPTCSPIRPVKSVQVPHLGFSLMMVANSQPCRASYPNHNRGVWLSEPHISCPSLITMSHFFHASSLAEPQLFGTTVSPSLAHEINIS